EEEELDTITVPEFDHALVTFIAGDAWKIADGEETFIDIGDHLEVDDTLQVDTGYVELQLGSIGTIRVQEGSTIILEKLILDPESAHIDIEVSSGSLLNRVERLAGTERYEVRTPTATMGVRGTEFGVDVEEGKQTRVAVREGRVSVVPRSADTEQLRERVAKAEASGAQEETLAAMEEAIKRIDEGSFVLEQEEELEMDQEDMSGGEESLKEIEQAMLEIEEKISRGEKVDIQETRLRLNRAAEESTSRMKEKTEVKRREISTESREELEKIEEIRVIPLMKLPAPRAEESPDDPEEPSETAERARAPALVPVTVRVEPEDAAVFLGEREVGRGRFSALFLDGEELNFSIRREGYEPVALELTVNEDHGRAYRVEMTALKEPESDTEPEEESTTEAEEPEPEPEEEPESEAAAEEETAADEKLETEEAVETSDSDDSAEAEEETEAELASFEKPEPEPETAMLNIQASPERAEIRIDGRMVGRGKFSREFTSGETVEVEARHPGFATELEKFTMGEDARQVSLRLTPQPLENTFPAAESTPVRALISEGSLIFGADKGGTLYGINPDSGDVSWKVTTKNTNNENSQPVAAEGYIALTGAAEMVVVNASTGKEESRRSLSGTQSHLFGRSVTPWNGRWLFPSDNALLVLDKRGEKTEREIDIPGGSKMSAALAGNVLVIADQEGKVLVINPEDGELKATISTGMMQPVALSAAADGETAYLSGRRGKAVAIDTETGSLLWETQLPQETGVYVNPVTAGPIVLFLQGNTLAALDSSDGSLRYELANAAGSAVTLGGSIYYATTTGELKKVDPSDGSVLGRVTLPANGAAAPAVYGERLAVPLEDGRISIIHTAGIQR
ncbi:MAG: PQQ-binding-like beta-propeller repeat protein, partial [Spirochaetaceae bacterium]